jgi:hypothetical protein
MLPPLFNGLPTPQMSDATPSTVAPSNAAKDLAPVARPPARDIQSVLNKVEKLTNELSALVEACEADFEAELEVLEEIREQEEEENEGDGDADQDDTTDDGDNGNDPNSNSDGNDDRSAESLPEPADDETGLGSTGPLMYAQAGAVRKIRNAWRSVVASQPTHDPSRRRRRMLQKRREASLRQCALILAVLDRIASVLKSLIPLLKDILTRLGTLPMA